MGMLEGINMAKVTIVIPLYNKERHIVRAINSALAQTFPDFELIVVDDGSTDHGVEKVELIADKRIRLIKQINGGVSTARNTGINAAHAELIAFLDADDQWMPDFLQNILRLRDRFPDAGIYSTAYRIMEPDGVLTAAAYRGVLAANDEGPINYFQATMDGPSPIIASAFAVTKTVFADVGLFPVGVRYGEDADLWCRIAMRYPVIYSRQICAIYHYNADNRACENRIMEPIWPFLYDGFERINKRDYPRDDADLYEYLVYKRLTVGRMLILDMGDSAKRRAKILLKGTSKTRRFKKEWLKTWLVCLLPFPITRILRSL